MSTGRGSGLGVLYAGWSGSAEDSGEIAPISNGTEYGPARVVVDGRIDNEIELRGALGAPGTTVDELLLRAYLAWGEEFVARVSGDFALVLWDSRSRRLLAARDPFGVRPLFYRASGREIRLASSVRDLVAISTERPVLDDQRITEYLLGRYVARDGTFFRDVRELPAGHLLVAERGNVKVSRYWRPPGEGTAPVRMGPEEFREEFRRLFIESVRERLRSSSPVIVHVSGGLDSSSIAGAADVIERRGDLPTPYVRGAAALHPGLPCDERLFIDAVARHVHFPIDLWDATVTEPPDLDLANPGIAQPGIRALYRTGTIGDVTIARAHGASVVLAGTGGDELGTVFGFVKDLIADHRWSAVIEELLFFPGATAGTRLARVRQVVRQSVPPGPMRWNAAIRARIPSWLAPKLHTLAKQLAVPESSSFPFASHLARYTWERVNSARLARVVMQFQEHGSLYGLEYRFPFLDRELVTFVLNLRHEHWPRPRPSARLHREPLADLLPPEVEKRQGKAEFTPALASRIRNARPQIQAILEDGPWCSEGYVDRGKAGKFCRAVLEERGTDGSAGWLSLWSIVTLEAWLRSIFGYHARSREVS